jgi:hypothetical protein
MSMVFRSLVQLFDPSGQAVDFTWQDWRYTDYFFYESDETVAPFQLLSNVANRAFTISVAELIAARFHAFADAREALEFFDCAWASILQEGACDYAVLPRDEWSGPIRGALRAAMLVVNETMFEAKEDGDYPARCVWILQLARHVMPKDKLPAFEVWYSHCKARLNSGWPSIPHRGGLFDEDFDRGPLPGPCVFVPTMEVTHASSERCLRDHVAALAEDNPWLVDPSTHPDPHGHSH